MIELTNKGGNKALLLLSGGQDSTLCGFIGKRAASELHALTINYGQRHASEIEAAHKIASILDVASHEVLDVGKILKGTSPLVSDEQLPQYEKYEDMPTEGVEPTFVPLRNMLFLTIAANHALALGCNYLLIGVCQADYAGYPDCRQVFIESMNQTLGRAVGDMPESAPSLEIVTPLMNMTKMESIQMAMTIPGAYEAWAYSHTAYDGNYPPTGNDHATLLRAKGFFLSQKPDPLVVRAFLEGKMDLPDYRNYNIVREHVNDIKSIRDLAILVGAEVA